MNQHFATLGASPDLKITRLPNGLTVVTEAMPVSPPRPSGSGSERARATSGRRSTGSAT